MMGVYLTRLEVCDLLIAITGIFIEKSVEAQDENTSETRRKICEESAKKWMTLHDKIERQLDAFDAELDKLER